MDHLTDKAFYIVFLCTLDLCMHESLHVSFNSDIQTYLISYIETFNPIICIFWYIVSHAYNTGCIELFKKEKKEKNYNPISSKSIRKKLMN